MSWFSERSTVWSAPISTSLAVMGFLHIANFAITDVEQILVQLLVQGLGHTFVAKYHSRKHWNNLFWVVYDKNDKEFLLGMSSSQSRVSFLWGF